MKHILNNKNKRILKILLVLTVALTVSSFSNSAIFIADSPQIRQNLVQQIALNLNPLRWGSDNVEYTSEEVKEELADVPFQELAPGVRAKEKDGLSYTEYNLDQVQIQEHKVVIDGKEYVINIPQGGEIPPDDIVKKVYGSN